MPKKNKILHVIDALGRGGTERLLITNLKNIDRNSFDHKVLVLFERRDSLMNELEGLSLPIFQLSLRDKHNFLYAIWKIMRVIRKTEADLVHTHNWYADIYGRIAGKLSGKIVISTIHDTHYEPQVLSDAPQHSKLKLNSTKYLDMLTANFCADGFIAVSDCVKDSVVRHLGLRNDIIRTIYNSIDLSYFNPIPEEKILQKKKELGIKDGEIVLITLGRVVPMKGQKYMIKALKKIVESRKNVRLFIRGTGWMQSTLEAYRDSLGLKDFVRFLGPQQDIKAFLQAGDIFLFTSLHEGLGIAQLEAMAMKKPVVAFAVGPIPEVVKDKVSGILVEPWDTDKLADAIVSLIDNPERIKEMGREGRAIVFEKFNIQNNVKQLESFYKGVLSHV